MIDKELKARVQEFCFMDDTFFNCFMKDTPEGMEYVLNIIMDRDDLHVERIETQHDIPSMFSRGVRFDVFVVDSQGKHYDFEVQRSDEGANPRRARYNSSMMDYLNLNKGTKWEDLPEIHIIFITEKDVLAGNKIIYKINRIIDDDNRPFNDGTQIIYINGAYPKADTKLGQLIQDFKCKDPTKMHSKLLAERMKYLKSTEAEVNSMCKIMEDYGNKRYNQGYTKGIVKVVPSAARNLPLICSRIMNLSIKLFVILDYPLSVSAKLVLLAALSKNNIRLVIWAVPFRHRLCYYFYFLFFFWHLDFEYSITV